MEEHKRIVEINGMKVEIDLRTAKRVDSFKVGDSVKLLKKSYGESYTSHFGMIVAFDEFKELPTIVVAYLTSGWEDPLKFEYVNAKSQGAEICHHATEDLGVSRADILKSFDRETAKKEQELVEIKRKRDYFDRMFGKYFPSEAVNVG